MGRALAYAPPRLSRRLGDAPHHPSPVPVLQARSDLEHFWQELEDSEFDSDVSTPDLFSGSESESDSTYSPTV